MESFVHPVQEAISGIEHFLHVTEGPSAALSPVLFQELSSRIQSASWVRQLYRPEMHSSRDALALFSDYRRSLQTLKQRLAALEPTLLEERSRLLADRDRVQCSREWHAALSRTR